MRVFWPGGWLIVMTGVITAAEPMAVKVMSFNVRYGTANDGENHWDRRKEFLVETIRAFGPDLLGTQETLGFQKDFLVDQLAGYRAVGVGRDDGGPKGEMTAVLYRVERFELLDHGHFWLSETPEIPGSKSWDTSLTRMATWLKLRDRQGPPDAILWFFNTHYDHRGAQARTESSRLLRRKIAELAETSPAIVTGDFNTDEGSPPYVALFGDIAGQVTLRDTLRVKRPDKRADEGTFSGFQAEQQRGARIDWIGCTTQWEVLEAGIDRTSREGRTPSDHFPVVAVLRLKAK
jgi:endonuclease/exonuclease/phosphatase family metal-dependent hydrolase